MAYSSLLLDSQQPLAMDDDDYANAYADAPMEDDEAGGEESTQLRPSALARHLNPALGPAAALLPHLRWLCACCGIATAASAADADAAAGGGVASASGSSHNTPGDANSAVTAIANLEQCALADLPAHSAAPMLTLLLKGEHTSSAASAPPASSSSGSGSGSSQSSTGSGTAVSVPGALLILRTLVAQNRLDAVRSALLGLLLQLCQKHAGSLRAHLSALIHMCLFVVRAEKLGRLKEKGMELLGFLLMLVHAHRLDISAQAEYTPPREIVQQLFREINVSKSKLTSTMRGNLLSTLGLLSELFEGEFRRHPEQVRELADLYGRALLEELDELKSTRQPKRDLNRKVVEGCLIGLKHFLMHFSEAFRINHQQKVLRLDNIYEAVRLAIGMQDSNRYDILRAGLSCFSRHAALFRPFIIPSATAASPAAKPESGSSGPAASETEILLSLLLQATRHANISVCSRANFALEAFLQQVASWLAELDDGKPPADGTGAAAAAAAASFATPIPPQKRRLFNLLLPVFIKKLDANKSAGEVSMAVRAVGQLAGVVALYLGQGELRKVLNRLLENCEKLFRSHTLDEVDRAVQHMADFFAAFAFVIKQLTEVDPGVLDYLVSMLRRFWLAYPTLTSTQRSRNTVSLTRLLVVLYDKGALFTQLLERTMLQALVLTVSELPQLTDVQFYSRGRPALNERHAYIEYCYLFHNLLGVSVRQDGKGDKSALAWNIGLDYPDETIVWRMRKALFDQIMTCTQNMLQTLDLSLVDIKRHEDAAPAADGQAGGGGAAAAASSSAASSVSSGSSSSGVESAGSGSSHSDPSAAYMPAKAKDFALFHNLIEFLQRFFFPPYGGTGAGLDGGEQRLTLNHHVSGKTKLRELVLPSSVTGSLFAASSFLPKWALGWVAILVPDLIQLSNKHPLVSGYYRCLALIGRIMEQFHYLDDVDLTDKNARLELEAESAEEEKSADRNVRVKVEGADKMETDAGEGEPKSTLGPHGGRKVPLDTVSNRRYVFQLMSDFLASVLVRTGQFTDELLYASIHLLLTAPLQFVRLDAWQPALVKAMAIGLNYRPAASLSIDVLNKWYDAAGGSVTRMLDDGAGGGSGGASGVGNLRFSSDDLTRLLPDILPHLYDYLRLPKADATAIAESSSDKKSKSTGTQRSVATESVEIELVSRILQFLGRVGGHNRFLLGRDVAGEADVAASSSAASTAVAPPRWEPTHAIKYALPLSQILNVHLDCLLPQLTHLAEFSSERKVQVAACEALHSLIIYMIATTARDPNRSSDGKTSDESAFLSIYQQLFPVILRLATSVEAVTKQLFHPLLFQIIHWFTNTATTLYKDTRALLDAVTDAVGNDANGALREYAATALAEFMRWAMKHPVPGAAAGAGGGGSRSRSKANEEKESASSAAASASGGGSINTKALFRRLYSLSLHPSPSKRLGAALTVNKMYTIFREHDSLVQHHTLDLLDHLLRSLRMAERDDEAMGTRDELRAAIANMERIVTDADARKFIQLSKSMARAGPPHCQSLKDYCMALLENAGSIEDDYRRESLRLFQSFCRVLPKAQGGQDAGLTFFQTQYIADLRSLRHFVAVVERGDGATDANGSGATAGSAAASSSTSAGPAGVRNETVPPAWMLKDDSDNGSDSDLHRWQSVQTWLRRLSSVLDVYWWLLGQKLLGESVEDSAAHLFGKEGRSELLESLRHFLLLMTASRSRVDQWVQRYADTSSATLAAAQKLKDSYAQLKCTVLIRLFRLVHLQMSDESAAAVASSAGLRSLLGHAFYSLVFRSLLLPEEMGFHSSQLKRIHLLQNTVGHLCTGLAKLPNKKHVEDALKAVLAEVPPASFTLSSLLNRVGHTAIIIEGYRQLWSSGLLALALGTETCSEFAHTLLDHAFKLYTSIAGHESERRVQLSPLGRSVAFQMLQLAFHIGVAPDELFERLTDQSPVELPVRPSRNVGTSASASSAVAPIVRVKLEQVDIESATSAVESDGVATASLGRDSRKGHTFYTQFKTLIDSYLAHKFHIFSAQILSRAFVERDMFALLLNVADFIINRRQRKSAVHHAFQPPSTAAGGDVPSSSFSSVLAQVTSQADSYVQHMVDGFAEACSAWMARRPSLASGSSTASASGGNKKISARQRSAAAAAASASPRDTSKLLQLPGDSELASMLLQLLERLLILDAPRVLSPATNPSFTAMMQVYVQCLGTDANVALKKKALSLLPALLWAPTTSQSSLTSSVPSLLEAPPGMQPVMVALTDMLMHPPFPPRSSDLMIGSPEYIDYTSLLDLLLQALVLSKNFALLQLLLPILREGESHTYSRHINVCLTSYLTALVDSSMGERARQVDELLDAVFDMFMQLDLDTSPTNNVRYWLCRYLLIPLLRLCSLSSARTFFSNHSKRIFGVVTALPDGPKLSSDVDVQRVELMELECAYGLIAIVYKRFAKGDPAFKEIPHKELIKYAHAHVKKCGPPSTSDVVTHGAYMRFGGAAYDALSSALMATQTDPKFLDVLCFTENSSKGEQLWSHLINVQAVGTVRFEIETNFATIDSIYADLRMLSRAPNALATSGADGVADGTLTNFANNSRYLSSQYLSDSSVSQDAQSLFENQQGPLQLMHRQQQDEADAAADSSDSMIVEEIDDASGASAMSDADAVVEMVDLDPLLSIPAMPVLLSLVQFMDERFGADHRAKQKDGEALPMPEWMQRMHGVLSASTTHVLIKWCIAKLIVLKPAIFQPYASLWFLPLVELLLKPSEESGAVGFNYFLRDVCSVFLRWRFVPGPDEPDRENASALLAHLMKVAVDHGAQGEGKRSRLRANLLTIKLLIDLWQHRLRIDRRIIHAHLTKDITRARAGSDALTSRQIGLQLLAIIIEKGFAGFDPIEDRSMKEDDMLRALVANLESSYKTIYEPAAEVLGIWIRRLAQIDHPNDEERRLREHALHLVRQSIKKLFFQREFGIFFNVLLKLSLYLGKLGFLNDDLLTFLFQVPQLQGDMLHKMLQLLCWSSTTTGRGMYERLKPTIRRVFLTVDAKAHESVLMILFRLAGELNMIELRELLPDLALLFPKHTSEACRMLYYKLLIWIYDNHEEFQPRKLNFMLASQSGSSGSGGGGSGHRGSSASSASSGDASHSDPLVHLVVVGLLRGLSDPVASVREHLFEFWDNPVRLSREVPDRLLKLLTSLFHAETVELWLSYATRLLMYPMRTSNDWKRPFSDDALEKSARFDVVNINASGYTRSQPMAPLFSSSTQQQGATLSMEASAQQRLQQQQQDPNGDLVMADFDDGGGGGVVLNSQAGGIQFAATPSLMSMNTQQLMDYNLSQSSQSEHLYYRGSGGASQAMMGSYQPFAASPQQRALRKRLKGKKRVSIKNAHRVQVGSDSVALRFAGSASGRGSNANKFRQKADMANRYARVWEARLAEESASAVTMYRTYRKGELPDIQITHRELLQPLEALHVEPAVAHQLFVTIFTAVYTQIHRNPEQTLRYRTDLRDAVRSLIHRLKPQMAAAAAPLVFALQTAILSVGRDDSTFTASWNAADIKQLGDISFHSNNFHSGVLLLEHIIGTKSEVKLRSNKRVRDEQTNERHEQAYFQLARLYRELGEHEIMMNLYATFAKQSYTRDAIAAMLRGDWSTAMSRYDDALTRFDQVRDGEAEWDVAPPSNDEIELWSDERLECLRQLTSWSALRENVMVEIDHQPDRLWDEQYAQKGEYLRHYFTSSLKCTEEAFLHISNAAASGGSDASSASVVDPRAELLQFVERAFKDSEQSGVLQNQHAADLVLMYALNNLTDHATTFLRQTYLRFLQQWTDLPQIATGPRLAMLQRLQKLTEVAEFLRVEQSLSSLSVPTAAAQAASAKKADPSVAVSSLLSISSDLQHQLSVWRTRLPSGSDSVETWDDIVLNRSAFLVHLKQSLEGRVASMPSAQQKELQPVLARVRADLSKGVVEMYRKAASVMLQQGNTSVADKYVSSSRQLLQAHGIARGTGVSESDKELGAQLDFLLTYSSIKVKWRHLSQSTPASALASPASASAAASSSSSSSDEQAKKLRVKSVKTLKALLDTTWQAGVTLKQHGGLAGRPSNIYRVATMKARLGQQLAQEHLLHEPSLSKYVDGKSFEEVLVESGDALDHMALTFNQLLDDPGLSGPGQAGARANLHKQACKAFMAVAAFCDERLTACEEHRDSCSLCKAKSPCIHPLNVRGELEAHLIEAFVDNVLGALKLGSSEARNFFPRALELMAQVSSRSPLQKKFRADTALVPSWMFIQWIPQLLSVLAQKQGPLAHPLLVRIAKEYPQAVVYPFNLSRESILHPNDASTAKAQVPSAVRSMIDSIGRHLNNKLIDMFVLGLDYLMVPEVKLRDMLNKLARLIPAGDLDTASRLWSHFRSRHISTTGSMFPYFGPVYTTFRTRYKTVLEEHLGGQDGAKVRSMTGAAGLRAWKNAKMAIDAVTAKYPGVGKDMGKYPLDNYIQLSKFDEWLAKTGESIELPGQYTGAQRPQPDLHVRIVSFDPTILIMTSMRRPKRLIIHGSDERSHPYLVKGGEDLRMDQRVEQVFATMNSILHADAAASRRRLGLRTYEVVPLTPSLGLLEWVAHTEPLKGLIADSIGPNGSQVFNQISGKYNANLLSDFPSTGQQPKPVGTHPSVYYNSIKNVDRKRVTEQFVPLQNSLPPDLIAKALSRMCNTPELFLSCRSTFARSFSTLSMCFYILGMGDRHLENFLVDTSNGELVGIDFGAAFGQGALLSVPELMPMRYTRQLQNMLAPLQTESILAQDMTYVMRALRTRKAVLTTVMDVFVKEPQMEWMGKTAKALGELGEDAALLTTSDWYPRRKMRVVQLKLDGRNPAYILSLELRENRQISSDPKLIAACVAHLAGEPGHKRAQLDLVCQPDEQVQVLLDMAKDPNILGRTWVGWGPFI